MELTLTRHSGTQIQVVCDGSVSHTFDAQQLIFHNPLHEPIVYGKAIYQAIFPPDSLARNALDKRPERLLLVTTDNDLEAIAWEFAYGLYGGENEIFIVMECHFVRGLPSDQRIPPPTIDTGLHIVAIPSNPLNIRVPPLNIDGEWQQLKEIMQQVPCACTLERTRPPTLDQLRRLVANQRNRVIHYMGHGGQQETGAFLCFEQENSDLAVVTAREFIQRVRGTAFLITLNTSASATPGDTTFSNLAAALVRQKVPYALGMRFSITDDDAIAFSRVFYNDLARGSSVEEALLQARFTLAKSSRPWVVGVPVLYTSLTQPATGFSTLPGTPLIQEHQPRLEVSVLPNAAGIFVGRIDELRQLGAWLTDDSRPAVITIHGPGGQGKTALAREAVERFAYAWPGGVWATSLENPPSREVFVNDLARFLGLDIQRILDHNELERLVRTQLTSHRTLIVLDSAEMLITAVEANDPTALQLAQFVQQLPSSSVNLLITSRIQLGWSGEVSLELGGLSPKEGANLFLLSASQRANEVDPNHAKKISQKLGGHPLALRLLGSFFNADTISLDTFIEDYEEQLKNAEDKHINKESRHHTLYASVNASIRYLSDAVRALLSKLIIFHASFPPETVTTVLEPECDDTTSSLIHDQLKVLSQHGLLDHDSITSRDGTVEVYRLHPIIRSYLEVFNGPKQNMDIVLARFGEVYARLVHSIYLEMNRSAASIYLARQAREDIERGISYVSGIRKGYYLIEWGMILQRLGDTEHARALIESSLEIAQEEGEQLLAIQALNSMATIYQTSGRAKQVLNLLEQAQLIAREIGDLAGEATTLNNLAGVYRDLGLPNKSLAFYEQTLSIRRQIGDRVGEGAAMSNMASVYQSLGQSQQALTLLENALPITREVSDRVGEAATLNNMARVYYTTGQPQRALALYEQTLSIMREVGDRAGEATSLHNIALVYQVIGQPQRALALYEQTLSIMREVSYRVGEATTFTTLASLYQTLGQPQKALSLLEQALPIQQEASNRAGEATALTTLASVYRSIGQPQQALALLGQALPIQREVGDRPGEATSLTTLAIVYLDIGRPQEALVLLEQALYIQREIGDRAGEATTLSNIATAYAAIGRIQEALELYQQALPMMQEVGNRSGEATTLTTLASVYRSIGQPQRALNLLEQALPIQREVGDRPGEATTLNNMALVFLSIGQPQRALNLLEQALSMMQEVGNRSGEATALTTLASVYRSIGQPQRALNLLEQALPIQREAGNRSGEAATLTTLATVYQEMGRISEASELLEEVLSIQREIKDLVGQASTLLQLGSIARDNREYDRARGLYEDGLAIARNVDLLHEQRIALHHLGRLAQEQALYEEAHAQYKASLSLSEDPLDKVAVLNDLALLSLESSEHEADPLFKELLATLERVLISPIAEWERQEAKEEGSRREALLNWFQTIIQDLEIAYTSPSKLGRAAALNRASSTLSSSPSQLPSLSATVQLVVKQLIDQYREVVTREAGRAGQIMLLTPVANPYNFTRPVTGTGFIGRDELFREIQRLWSKPPRDAFLIYGHRRMGKTSLGQAIAKRCNFGDDTLSIYHTLESSSISHEGHLYYEIASDIWMLIEDQVSEADKKYEPSRKDYRPSRARGAFKNFLTRFHRITQKNIILILDEFDLLNQYLGLQQANDAVTYLRGQIQSYPWLAIALIGLNDLDDLRRSYKSPLLGWQPIHVSFLEANETENLLTNPYYDPDFPLEYTREALNMIHKLTNGQPYLVQVIGYHLVNHYNRIIFTFRQEHSRVLDVSDVQSVLDNADFYGTAVAYFQGLWDQQVSKDEEKELLKALSSREDGMDETVLQQAVSLNERVFREALETLKRHDILYEDNKRICYTVPLMRRWIFETQLSGQAH